MIETVEKQSRAPSPGIAALAYCEGTPLRNEIEARGVLKEASDHAARTIQQRHGSGEVSAKIQGLVVSDGLESSAHHMASHGTRNGD